MDRTEHKGRLFAILDRRCLGQLDGEQLKLLRVLRGPNHHERRGQRIRSRPRDKYTRDEIFERDGWICAHCLTPVLQHHRRYDPRRPEVDHIVPIADGGSDTLDNVTCCHAFCNNDRPSSARRVSVEEARGRLSRRVTVASPQSAAVSAALWSRRGPRSTSSGVWR
ncbi:HNH endonuclease [Streptomyces sp. NPDC048483]|uniref:HNH endonuclease n=1 Tax=Streptomyces sp. NPDC048483 TaxID=3154927 RepID=UPI0034293C1D